MAITDTNDVSLSLGLKAMGVWIAGTSLFLGFVLNPDKRMTSQDTNPSDIVAYNNSQERSHLLNCTTLAIIGMALFTAGIRLG